MLYKVILIDSHLPISLSVLGTDMNLLEFNVSVVDDMEPGVYNFFFNLLLLYHQSYYRL